ncbi:hypothetical protein YC2023_115818 [Brassica napus]
MSSVQRLSRQQKAKSVAATSAPARNPDGGCTGDLKSAHHTTMMDAVNLSRSQRLLVADATRLAREGSENVAVRDATECARDGQSGAVPVDSITLRARAVEYVPSEDDDSEVELFPTTFYPEGIFGEFPRLHPDLLRPAFVAGQDWDGVDETKSTPRSVKRVLRATNATGVTFLIPTKEQRPWSPPIGYQMVYESYFQDDTRCWFPVPRLITAYARRRDLAISQLLNGSLRLAVTLSVLAEQIDMPMSVRSFEEMTSITDMKDGTYSVKMRPNCNVCAGHPNKTQNWQRSYFFLKSDDSAFEEPPREDYRVLWNRSCGRISCHKLRLTLSILTKLSFCCACSWPSYVSSLSRGFPEERSSRRFASNLPLVRNYRREDSRA